ncbi:OmpA family protein [bacterium]|nr:OmpA family protein [bacterium]
MSGGGGGGCPMWVLTYADMITVLMGFFVIMSTMNKPEEKEAVAAELVQQFGTPDSIQRFMELSRRRSSAEENKKKQKEKLKGRSGHDERVTTIRDGGGLTIGGPVYFRAGRADLSEESKTQLNQVADVIRGKPNIIAIKAYRPRYDLAGMSKFETPSALASARAEAVCNYLVSKGGLREDSIRLEVGAPVEGSNLVIRGLGLSASDRVDIVVLEPSKFDYEPSPMPPAPAPH